MAHEVIWTKLIVETFLSEANLSKEDEMILRTRAAGWSRTRQSTELNMSLSSIDRRIKRMKQIYDVVQKTNPILPPRKESKEEEWMDTH